MSDTKFTKGPWWLSGKGTIRAGESAWVAHCSWHNKEANAHLIAAAPDLYEALYEIFYYQGGADSVVDDEYVMERAKAALAKARGES